jgi:hypothetical protein
MLPNHIYKCYYLSQHVDLKTNLQPCLEEDGDVQEVAEMLIVQNENLRNSVHSNFSAFSFLLI